MDALGAALAVLALGVYPGGLYLLFLSRCAGWFGGLAPGTRSLERADVLALVAAFAAAALTPLPGTPAAVLPPQGGASPDAILVGVLAALAVAAPGGGSWSRWRTAGVTATGAGALVLAGAAGSLSLLSIAALPGAGMTAARSLAGAALITVAPLAAGTDGAAPRIVRSTVMTMLMLIGASLMVPSGIHDASVVAAAAVVSAAVLGCAAALRAAPLLGSGSSLLGAGGVVLSTAAVVVAAIAPR
jgi:hypothetical protein